MVKLQYIVEGLHQSCHRHHLYPVKSLLSSHTLDDNSTRHPLVNSSGADCSNCI